MNDAPTTPAGGALVVGAGSGIGRAVAEHFARARDPHRGRRPEPGCDEGAGEPPRRHRHRRRRRLGRDRPASVRSPRGGVGPGPRLPRPRRLHCRLDRHHSVPRGVARLLAQDRGRQPDVGDLSVGRSGSGHEGLRRRKHRPDEFGGGCRRAVRRDGVLGHQGRSHRAGQGPCPRVGTVRDPSQRDRTWRHADAVAGEPGGRCPPRERRPSHPDASCGEPRGDRGSHRLHVVRTRRATSRDRPCASGAA